MNITFSSNRIGEGLARASQHWMAGLTAEAHESTGQPRPPEFTVAISRQHGANGTTIATKLGERLNWPVYDRELLNHIAKEEGLNAKLVESADERRVGLLEWYLQGFSPNTTLGQDAYVHFLVKTLLALAVHGECILVGRGAAQLLPAETTLRVRLISPLEDRIAAIQKRFSLTHEEAAKRVQKKDRDRDRFIRDTFHKDPADPMGYDLVLNVARFSVEECVDLIAQALQHCRAHAAVSKSAASVSPTG
jgi:cytidylate kinase